MATYEITQVDLDLVESHIDRPLWHKFWYKDNGALYYDDAAEQFFGFDYDAIMLDIFTQDLATYVSFLKRKPIAKAERYVEELSGNIKDEPYDIMWLISKETFVRGEKTKVEYFDSYDETIKVYSDLVVQVDIIYEKDVHENYTTRTKTHKWINDDEDETITETKTTDKVYSPIDWMKAAERRRWNIVTSVKAMVVGYIMATEWVDQATAEDMWKPFMSGHTIAMSQYKDWDRDILVNDITAQDGSVHAWLNNPVWADWEWNPITVKDAILAQLIY